MMEAAARDALEMTVRLFPENPSARHLLALTLFREGQLERALVLYEGLAAEHPDSLAVRVNLAVVLLKLGRASSARPLLEEVVRLAPGHRRAWGYLGVTLEQLGLIAEAEGALLAGHFGGAAKRLRERHAETLARQSLAPDVTPENARRAMPAFRRRTLPPHQWASLPPAVTGSIAYPSLPKFAATLQPPDLPPADQARQTRTAPAPAPDSTEPLPEIAFEQTMTAPKELAPPPISRAPKQSNPVIPLLDAALSSLLIVPHEAVVVSHPSGLVLVGLEQADCAAEGGFAARSDAVHAFAGSLRRGPLPRRPSPAPDPFQSASSAFVRVAGAGQLVLAPSRGKRLLPLDMDADVAFLREELIVGFDHALLYDLGRLRGPSSGAISLVRFRGDGVIVLGLEGPFLAFDVHGDEVLTLRAAALVGWIGLLAPEPAADDPDMFTFSGEGTVLFRAPQDPRKEHP
ncbi:MAG TPA: tetratricopeptide repeat protein [Polyangiaceae bacterium]|nr:tetratricopeptide repeat protein [Polyangiaceae bacterium]